MLAFHRWSLSAPRQAPRPLNTNVRTSTGVSDSQNSAWLTCPAVKFEYVYSCWSGLLLESHLTLCNVHYYPLASNSITDLR